MMYYLYVVWLTCWMLSYQTPSVTGQECPELPTLRYEAALNVSDFFAGEVDALRGQLDQANDTREAARQALANCYGELESAKSLKNARIEQAGALAKEVGRLESKKDVSKATLDRAHHSVNSAKTPHAAAQKRAADARQRANEALLIAQERSRAAALAWAEANAIQQSTQWVPTRQGSMVVGVPHNHLQKAGTYAKDGKVPPVQTKTTGDASKLAEIAKAADYAVAIAEAEARRLNEIANAAERAVNAHWNSLSPSYHSYTHAQRDYQAICEEYAQKRAIYDAAVLAINSAETLIMEKKQAIKEALENLNEEEKKFVSLKAQLEAALVVAEFARTLVETLATFTTTTTTAAPPPPVPAPAPAPGSAPTAVDPNNLNEILRRIANLAGTQRSTTLQSNRAPARSLPQANLASTLQQMMSRQRSPTTRARSNPNRALDFMSAMRTFAAQRRSPRRSRGGLSNK